MNITASMDSKSLAALQALCLKVLSFVNSRPNQRAHLNDIEKHCLPYPAVEALMLTLDRGHLDQATTDEGDIMPKTYEITERGRGVLKRGRLTIKATKHGPDVEGDPNPDMTRRNAFSEMGEPPAEDPGADDQDGGEEEQPQPRKRPQRAAAKPAPARSVRKPAKAEPERQKPTPAKPAGKGKFPARRG